MQTEYVHRMLITIPESVAKTFGPWFRDNIDPPIIAGDGTTTLYPGDDTSTWPKRNATGKATDPPTHRVANGAFTDKQAKLITEQLASLGGKTPPKWDKLDEDAKRKWVEDSKADLLVTAGVYAVATKNDSDLWPDKVAAEAAVGVKEIETAKVDAGPVEAADVAIKG